MNWWTLLTQFMAAFIGMGLLLWLNWKSWSTTFFPSHPEVPALLEMMMVYILFPITDCCFTLFAGLADVVLVNSNFTAETFMSTFTSLRSKRPSVLYPSLNFKAFDLPVAADETKDLIPPSAKTVFLSINRYERKKNLKLALEALAWLKNILSEAEWKGVHLMMAGEGNSHHWVFFFFSFLFYDIYSSIPKAVELSWEFMLKAFTLIIVNSWTAQQTVITLLFSHRSLKMKAGRSFQKPQAYNLMFLLFVCSFVILRFHFLSIHQHVSQQLPFFFVYRWLWW